MAVTLSQFVQYVKTLDLTPTDVMPQDGWIIYGDGNVLKRVNSNTIISSIIQAGFEVIDGSTVIPATGYRRYRVLQPGTYTGITVTQEEINNNWVYIVVDEGVSSKELEPKPDFGSTIRDWVNTEDGLVFPDVRHYDNKVFRVVEGETVTGTDVPGVSLKWLLLIEDTSSLLIQVNNNTDNIGDMSALAYGNVVEAINAALVASNGSLFLENLIDVSIPSPADGEALIFNGSEWVASPDLDIRIGEIEGLGLFANQTAQEISIKNASGVTLSTLSVAFLNNEGTTFSYNATTEKLELKDDVGTILAEIPVSAFVSNLAKTISLGGNKLDLKDTAGNILSFVEFGIGNIDGLQAAINVKVDKVTGKSLSTNDYTTTEKNKLAGIEAGAEVNLTDGATQTYVNDQDTITLQSAKDYADGLNDPTVDHTYLTVPAMIAAQNEQLEDDLIKVTDAGADSRITGKAYYFYNGTTAGTLDDYHLLSNSELATLTGQAVIDALGYTPEPLRIAPTVDDQIQVFNLDGSERYENIPTGTGTGDMLKATYDPTSKNADAFAMANMAEGATTKILTDAERLAISNNSEILSQIEISRSNISYGEAYIANYRNAVLDDGATFFPSDAGYQVGKLKESGVMNDCSLLLLPSAVKAGTLYSVKPQDRSGDFTVDRNCPAKYTDEDGILKTALANVPRIDYSTGEAVLLVEPQRTNLITYSEAFENGYWKTGGGLVASASNLIDPEGNYQAREIIVNDNLLYAQPSGIVDGLTYTMSCWYHGTIGETLRLRFYDGTSFLTKTIILTGVWQREYFTFLVAEESIKNFYYIDNRADSNASVVNVWGAQLEEGTEASSYIPTNGATETRLADQISVPTPAGVTSITETIDGVDQTPITTIPTTYSLPVGNINKVTML